MDLTQNDNDEDEQEPLSPTSMSLNNNSNHINSKDPQPSYAQHQAGNEYVDGSDVDAGAPRRPALFEANFFD